MCRPARVAMPLAMDGGNLRPMRHESKRCFARVVVLGVALSLVVSACNNNPYPDSDDDTKVLYTSFRDAPRSLDPAVAYTTASHAVTGNVYDTLLEFHYLKRPFELIPGLAEAIPEPEPQGDGRVRYTFRLRPDLLFQDDPSFALGGPGAVDPRNPLAGHRLSTAPHCRSGDQQPGLRTLFEHRRIRRLSRAVGQAARRRGGFFGAFGARAVPAGGFRRRDPHAPTIEASRSFSRNPTRKSSTGLPCLSRHRFPGKPWNSTTAKANAIALPIIPWVRVRFAWRRTTTRSRNSFS